jgi:membrane-associated phospholipid phosphatase
MISEKTSPRLIVLFTTLISVLIALALCKISNLYVDILSFYRIFGVCAVIALFIPYLSYRKMTRLKVAIEVILIASVMTIPSLIFSYSAVRFNMPMADVTLANLDTIFSYRPENLLYLVNKSKIISNLLILCYTTFTIQLYAIPFLIAIMGDYKRAYSVLFIFIVMCFIQSMISIYFPSVGAFVHYGIVEGQFENVSTIFGVNFLEIFYNVRNSPEYVLTLTNSTGIMTFPSLHAGVAIMCGWAVWGMRWVSWPIILINCGMFLSALVNGAHYLVDVLAGSMIAVLVIMAARVIFKISSPKITNFIPNHAARGDEALARSIG